MVALVIAMNAKLLPAFLLFAVGCGGPDTDFSESSAVPVNPPPAAELCDELWDTLPQHTHHQDPMSGVIVKDGPVLLGIWKFWARTTNRGNSVKIGPHGFAMSPNFPAPRFPARTRGVRRVTRSCGPDHDAFPVQCTPEPSSRWRSSTRQETS